MLSISITYVFFLLGLAEGILGDTEPRTVVVNVGGTQYTTTPATLTRYMDSTLAAHYTPLKTSYFYDRDGDMFRHILNYLRSGRLLLPRGFDQFDLLRNEAASFNLYMLLNDIAELQHNDNADKKAPSIRDTSGDQYAADPPMSTGEGAVDDAYECIILCADEDGKVERWFSAPNELRFENNGCLLGDCEMITGYSYILDYRDYSARPGNTVPHQFNIAAIVTRLLKAGFNLTSSSSGVDEWHREFYFVFIRRFKKEQK